MTNSLADIVVKATPGEWEVVEATEHHGWYVTSEVGNTICDLYCMSRPDLPATINGGASRPVRFMHEMDGPNAQLIALAPTLATLVLEAREKGAALMRELVWVNEQLDLMPDDYAEAHAQFRATLAKLESL